MTARQILISDDKMFRYDGVQTTGNDPETIDWVALLLLDRSKPAGPRYKSFCFQGLAVI